MGYRPKSEDVLAWGEIERSVRYHYNLAAANAKARLINEVLPAMQAEFQAAFKKDGTLLSFDETKARFDELTKEVLAELAA